MRKLFLSALIVLTINCYSQSPGSYYVAAKNGLSLREEQSLNSRVLVKIPYGSKINTRPPDTTSAEILLVEGLTANWVEATWSGKAGYIVDSYLLPWPPPKATVKTMKQYLAQVSPVAGTPLFIKGGGAMAYDDMVHNTKKQLFKNGAEYHEETFYESNNDSYFLPDFTLQQGFILIRLIPEFKDVFTADAVFPLEDAITKRNESDYTIKVEKEMLGERNWVHKIKVEYESGAFYSFEMFQLGGQLVISYGGGV